MDEPRRRLNGHATAPKQATESYTTATTINGEKHCGSANQTNAIVNYAQSALVILCFATAAIW